MSEPRIKLDPKVFDRNCQCGSDECPVCTGHVRRTDIAEHTWFDNRSWQPQPQAQSLNLPSPSVVPAEAQPGSLDYLRLGCDDLWQDGCGGEG